MLVVVGSFVLVLKSQFISGNVTSNPDEAFIKALFLAIQKIFIFLSTLSKRSRKVDVYMAFHETPLARFMLEISMLTTVFFKYLSFSFDKSFAPQRKVLILPKRLWWRFFSMPYLDHKDTCRFAAIYFTMPNREALRI